MNDETTVFHLLPCTLCNLLYIMNDLKNAIHLELINNKNNLKSV
jgi:hypothetical protein